MRFLLMMLGLALSLCSPVAGSSAGPLNIVCVGDSITFGSQSSSPGGATSYPAVLAGLLGLTYDSTVRNLGVSGIASIDLPDPDYLLNTETNRNVIIVSIGINDIAEGPLAEDAEGIADVLEAWVDDRVAAGWVVWVLTPTGVGNFDMTQQTTLSALAVEYRNRFDNVVDVSEDSDIGIGADSNSEFYSGDDVHLSDVGYAHLADIIADALDLTLTADPVASDAYGIQRGGTLTWWGRDWWRANNVTRKAFDLFNLAQDHATEAPYQVAHSGEPDDIPEVVTVMSHKALSFPGEADAVGASGYYASASNLTTIIAADAFSVKVICTIDAVTGTDAADPRNNEAIFDDAAGLWGLYLRNTSDVIRAVAFGHNGAIRQAAAVVTISTKVLISMRLLSGQLGVRIGSGVWTETTFTNPVGALTGPFRIGQAGGTGTLRFDGTIFETIIRNAYDADEDAADLAYITARHGAL